MSPPLFRTVAGRWKECSANGANLRAMPPNVRVLVTGTFYAGFMAALEAVMEATEHPQAEGSELLQALVNEVAQFQALMERTVAEGPTQ